MPRFPDPRAWFRCSTGRALALGAAALTGPLAAQCALQWQAVGANDAVLCSHAWDADGPGPLPQRLVVGGRFTSVAGTAADRIAALDPATGIWLPLGTGIGGANAEVRALVTLPNGDLVAGGSFTTAGGAAAGGLARWNGTTWSPLGAGSIDTVRALAVLPNGDLVAGGTFAQAFGVPALALARWDGVVWSAFGGANGSVRCLLVAPDGSLFVGGDFTFAGGLGANRVVRWNGSAWQALGPGLSGAIAPGSPMVVSLANRPAARVLATGHFLAAGGTATSFVAEWDGAAWSALGPGLAAPPQQAVTSSVELPNSDLLAGGFGVLSRWNGATWSAQFPAPTGIDTIAALPGGDLLVGGTFAAGGGVPSPFLARLTTTCPATAAPAGTGCAGATLAAATPPWVDATLRTIGTGLPATAIVLGVTGMASIPQGALPLTSVFPQAGAGCDLLTTPDILAAMVTTNGGATLDLFLPSAPPLVGVTFHQQMVAIGVDAVGAWVAVVATNRLQLTAGAF